MRRLLCVTAHPDDEAASFGGTLLKCAASGVQAGLVCLTAGEAARNRGRAVDNEQLASLRAQELARSCELLKIGTHQIWSYPDGRLMEINFHEAAGRLVKVIREFQPQVVLTMGPEGGVTAHPDHGVAGLLATAAFHWAGQERYYRDIKPAFQAQRLFWVTATAQPEELRKEHPVLLPPVDVEVDIGAYVDAKIGAFKAHATQAPLLARFEEFVRAGMRNVERFHLAAAPGDLARAELRASGDLFYACSN